MRKLFLVAVALFSFSPISSTSASTSLISEGFNHLAACATKVDRFSEKRYYREAAKTIQACENEAKADDLLKQGLPREQYDLLREYSTAWYAHMMKMAEIMERIPTIESLPGDAVMGILTQFGAVQSLKRLELAAIKLKNAV